MFLIAGLKTLGAGREAGQTTRRTVLKFIPNTTGERIRVFLSPVCFQALVGDHGRLTAC